MKNSIKLLSASLLAACAMQAQAVTVSMQPETQFVDLLVEDEFTIDILYDTEGINTVGGAFSINFDTTAFEFISFDFAPDLNDDTAFRVVPDSPVANEPFNLGFGSFVGFEGTGTAGTLTFRALEAGVFNIAPGTPLPGHDAFFEGASYLGATVEVSEVPLPAAGWMLLTAVCGLAGVSRSKRKQA